MLLAGAVSVEGTVYYVSESSAGSGDGSSYDNRMSVVNHNAGSFIPGDTIYLVDTISSRIVIPSSGTSGNEITYKGDYAGHPGVLTANTSYGAIRGLEKSYITIDGVELRNGIIGTAFLNNCNYITIKKCLVHDMTSKGIYFSSNTDPRERNSNIIIGGAEGDGNEVYNVGVDTGGNDIIVGSSDNVIISYNECYGENSDTGIEGIHVLGCDDVIIEYNEVYDHNKRWSASYPDMGEDGIDSKWSTNVIIRFNHVYGNRVAGIATVDQYGLSSSDVWIYGNYVHDHRTGISIEHLDNNLYAFGNVVVNTTGGHGISVSTLGNNIQIYNNTIVNCHGDGTNYGILFGYGTNLIAKNNIIYSDTNNDLVCVVKPSETTLDNNRYYYTGGTARIRWDGIYKTLAQIQALGQEANGSEGDPGLNDVGNDDFTLASDSACIDAGSDLGIDYALGLDPANTDFTTFPPSVYTLDQDNYGTGWEIGAYVFTGIACLPIDRTNWSVEFVDSEELVEDGGYPAENSYDGDPDTFWSTEWSSSDPDPCHPHEIQIDLGGFYDICGFRYLPRQDVGVNGTVKDYEFRIFHN